MAVDGAGEPARCWLQASARWCQAWALLGSALGGAVEVVGRLEEALLLVRLDAALQVDRGRPGADRPGSSCGRDSSRSCWRRRSGSESMLKAWVISWNSRSARTFASPWKRSGWRRRASSRKRWRICSSVALRGTREDGVEVPWPCLGPIVCLILYKRRAVERTASGTLRLGRDRAGPAPPSGAPAAAPIGSGVRGFCTSALARL